MPSLSGGAEMSPRLVPRNPRQIIESLGAHLARRDVYLLNVELESRSLALERPIYIQRVLCMFLMLIIVYSL